MALTNGSFEDQQGDFPSWPNGWDPYASSVFWDVKYFVSLTLFSEPFSYDWSSNEDSLDEFGPGDITLRIFDTGLENYEDFEEEWSSNEDALDAWPSSDDDRLFDEAGDAFEDFEEEWPSRHEVIDTQWISTASFPDPGTPATVHAALNEIKAKYEIHRADATVHSAPDSTNTISAADASDLATSRALCDELWVDCWAHIDDSGEAWHRPYETVEIYKPTIPSYPTTDYNDCASVALFLILKINLHFSWGSNSGAGYVTAYEDPVVTSPFLELRSALVGEYLASANSEHFETDWRDNQSSIAAFVPATHLDDFLFTIQGGTDTAETFDDLLTLVFPAAGTTAGAELALSPTIRAEVSCGGTFVGEAYVQTRDKGSATWVTRSTITSVPVTIQLDDGYEAVRIYTQTYSSGSPTATLHFRDME